MGHTREGNHSALVNMCKMMNFTCITSDSTQSDFDIHEDAINNRTEVPGATVPLDLEVMRVLNGCQQLIRSLANRLDISLEESETLLDITKLKQRLSTHTVRAPVQRHRRLTLSTDSRRILKEWFDAHEENPYPTPLEKHVLAAAASMSIKQVNDWFTNHRKRYWNVKESNDEHSIDMSDERSHHGRV